MRCYVNQLASKLQQRLELVYMVLGDEPFQVQQCCHAIKTAAKQHGYDEHIRLSVTPQFDWQEIEQHLNSLSLFSDKKIIELDFADAKAGQQGAKVLKSIAERPNPDCLILIKGNKNGPEVQKTAWFKALDNIGLFVPCYEITGHHLHTWLNGQCQQLQLNLDGDAKALLLESTQGNLLATYQELEKLSLLYGQAAVSRQLLAPVLLNQAKFDIFDLTDALLQGNSKQAVTIVARLQKDNTEITSIAWAIAREAQQLFTMQTRLQQGLNKAQVFKECNIWKNRQAITEQALNRLPYQQLTLLISQLALFDRHFKQGTLACPFQAITHIALGFCQPVNVALPIYHDPI
ncbi:DNA polymerase III subunit delta [Pseudoalteromonas ulvae]|uniref:DNA polymerase III subunit delta n=1 Tax=Pseudoalteromonas ulvae TaxID=107327 RepID=A0A244CVA8_PSEDV|nr:DNA polymerase III subunit delta [Pseudoalteromonas ulvae]OUL59528.1 DNA polymerase III subunit delta [Pseudoalteromonas ulvae]